MRSSSSTTTTSDSVSIRPSSRQIFLCACGGEGNRDCCFAVAGIEGDASADTARERLDEDDDSLHARLEDRGPHAAQYDLRSVASRRFFYGQGRNMRLLPELHQRSPDEPDQRQSEPPGIASDERRWLGEMEEQ